MFDSYIPTVFFTLLLVVDPLGLIPVFLVYLSGYRGRRRAVIIVKAILISIVVSVLFIFAGEYLLKFLGVSSGSFLVAGGILLFLIAMEMLLGAPSRTTMRDACESAGECDDGDVSVFPLAIPMLCGPGNIAALLMFSAQTGGDTTRILALTGVSVTVFLIAMAVMFASGIIGRVVGRTGIAVMQRLMGLILSAIAVQFIRNGLASLGIIP